MSIRKTRAAPEAGEELPFATMSVSHFSRELSNRHRFAGQWRKSLEGKAAMNSPIGSSFAFSVSQGTAPTSQFLGKQVSVPATGEASTAALSETGIRTLGL